MTESVTDWLTEPCLDVATHMYVPSCASVTALMDRLDTTLRGTLMWELSLRLRGFLPRGLLGLVEFVLLLLLIGFWRLRGTLEWVRFEGLCLLLERFGLFLPLRKFGLREDMFRVAELGLVMVDVLLLCLVILRWISLLLMTWSGELLCDPLTVLVSRWLLLNGVSESLTWSWWRTWLGDNMLSGWIGRFSGYFRSFVSFEIWG